MKHYLQPPQNVIDLNKVCYDLALIYAKEKFRYALEHNAIPNDCPEIQHPEYLDETQYLLKEFECALSEYHNQDENQLLSALDFTYTDDTK